MSDVVVGSPADVADGSITSAKIDGQIALAKGGTGQATAAAAFDALSPMTAVGDLIVGGTAGTRTRFAGNVLAARRFLRQTGTGAASAAPAWDTLQSGDMPSGYPTLAQVTANGASTALASTFSGGLLTHQIVPEAGNTLSFGDDVHVVAAVGFGHGSSSATVSAVTLRPTLPTGTDVAGAAMTVSGGPSTGLGVGGALILTAAPPTSLSGTTQNGGQTRLQLNPGAAGTNHPKASATESLLQLGETPIAGGSGAGTFLGLNAPSGFAGDLANFQTNGVSQLKVDAAGNLTQKGVTSAQLLGADSNGKLVATAALTNAVLPTVDVAHGGTGATSLAAASLVGTDASSPTAALRPLTIGSGLSLAGSTLSAVAASEAIGTMKPWPGVASTIPTGWLACDGSAVSRATYPALWAMAQANFLATSSYAPFGPGNGSTTFNVPDTRDRVIYGAGGAYALGTTPGADTASTGASNTGSSTVSGTTGNGGAFSGVSGDDSGGATIHYDGTVSSPNFLNPATHTHIHGVNLPDHTHPFTSGGHAHTTPSYTVSTLQPGLALSQIIRAL